MGEVLKKFGRYFLLDQIAQGGMAEIYRARLSSIDGAGRIIVIKKVQAGFGTNSEFLQMFKSEIKVTMGFNHPNIVQLYDFGEEQEQPYIAMEWVDGRNLRQLTSRFAEKKQPFPVELAAFIAEQAAAGLHYAHSFKDKLSGIALNIVHRDISPQNILISFDGNVKVIDFGIAKATTNIESTRAGVIKGKPSYLSPEQISGDALDGRSDIFALGAVLWELLTGKKLFAGENDLAVLKLIESCQTHVKPPSTLNPKIPKEMDYIVLKSLAKQREKRYQTAEELQRALHKFLYSYAPDFNPSDLAYWAKDLFKNEIVEDRKRIQKLNEKVEQLLSSEISDFIEFSETEKVVSSAPIKREDTTTLVDKNGAKIGAELVDPQLPSGSHPLDLKSEMDLRPASARGAKSSQTSNPKLKGQENTPSKIRMTRPSYSQSSQQRAQSSEESSSEGSLPKILIVGVGALFLLALLGPGFGIRVPFLSNLLRSESTNQAVAFSPIDEKKIEKAGMPTILGNSGSPGPTVFNKSILLRLNIIPTGGSPTITVGGKPVPFSNPVLQVPLDEPLEIVVERPDFKPFRREAVLDSRQMNGLKEWSMDIPLESSQFGFLSIRTTPSADATLFINGTAWKRKTPIENEKLPVGTYTIQLANEVLGMEKTLSVTIHEGKVSNVDEKLEIKNP